MNPQAYLVPEDQSHYATNELHDQADPQDIHKLQNKTQRFIWGFAGRWLKGLPSCAEINHDKAVALPDWALRVLLENTGLCLRNLECRD